MSDRFWVVIQESEAGAKSLTSEWYQKGASFSSEADALKNAKEYAAIYVKNKYYVLLAVDKVYSETNPVKVETLR